MNGIAKYLLIAVLFSCSNIKETPAQSKTGVSFINPVLNRDFADPTIIKGADGFYYAYGTNSKVDGKLFIDKVTYSNGWPVIGDGTPSFSPQKLPVGK